MEGYGVEKRNYTVATWMNKSPITIQPSMRIKDALTILCQYKKNELPVVEEGRVHGILRIYDVIASLDKTSGDNSITAMMKSDYTTVFADYVMEDITHLPVYIVDRQSGKMIGELSEVEMLTFQKWIMQELNDKSEAIQWYELTFDTAYEGLTVVNEKGVIQLFNQAYSRYVGVPKEEAVGRLAEEVIENTRLPVVLKTGVPERSQAHRLQGQNLVVHRIPIWKDNKVIGAAGILVYEGTSEIYQAMKRMEKLDGKHILDSKVTLPDIEENQIHFEDILGESPTISQAKKIARKAADSNATVLITGESGVGKEQFAKAIHYGGMTKAGPFISVNCAAIPDGLMESELFGYTKGSFTGADKEGKPGKFELAHNGTIFLDEIGDMPLNMQAKILRVLQDKKIVRIGGNKSISVNFRLISATNKDLKQLVCNGDFREDLYYRLYVIPIHIPPLRERKEDLPILIAHKLESLAKIYGMKEKTIDQKLLKLMRNHHWSGNIRELMNVLERLFVLTDSDHISLRDLPDLVQVSAYQDTADVKLNHIKRKKQLMDEVSKEEEEIIEQTLRQVNGNKSQAARLLGVSRSTLYNKLSRYKNKKA